MITARRHIGTGSWLDPLTYVIRAVVIGEKDEGAKFIPMLACPNKHLASLGDHNIADDGTVTPSVVCPEPGCGFHEMIKLEDWTGT